MFYERLNMAKIIHKLITGCTKSVLLSSKSVPKVYRKYTKSVPNYLSDQLFSNFSELLKKSSEKLLKSQEGKREGEF